jgi:hypothetical protein
MLINVAVPPGLAAALVGIPAIIVSLIAHDEIAWGMLILFVIFAYSFSIIPAILHMLAMELVYYKLAKPKTIKAVVLSGASGFMAGLLIAFLVLLGRSFDPEMALLVLFYSVLGLFTGLGTGWIIKLFDDSPLLNA